MKKIIDGKRYDTDTAEQVASWDSGHSSTDFHYCSETLYLTKKKAWFLYGEGGALSKYAQTIGTGRCGGADLIVFTPDQAREWLEQHSEVKALEEHFPVEDG